MTPGYDTEMLRVALERTIAAADAMLEHELPDWMLYRVASIRGECFSLREALDVRSPWLIENLTPSQRAYAREMAIERKEWRNK